MKSHTDIEQSQKLAEILPLESADMAYLWHSTSDNPTWRYDEDMPPMVLGNVPINELTCGVLPRWSLSTLLSVLDFPSLTQNKEDEWEVCVPNHKSDGYIEVSADNPVDACYEMILKLKEKNLL